MSNAQASGTPPYPSVLEPVSRSLDWTGQVLFRPFDIGKWFVLGFCGWLAWLGQSGGSTFNWNQSGDDFSDHYSRAESWINAYLGLLVFLIVAIVIVALALWVLILWLSSRGRFMFLDGVVQNRGAVTEPWARFRAAGNSLFGFRIVMALLALVSIGAVVALMVLSLLPLGLTEQDELAPAVIVFALLWVAVILALAFAFALVDMMLTDFIVPIMWLRGCRVKDAWREFLPLFSANVGTFVLYVLFKIVIAVAIALIACVATCVTCCIAALPYIGTVILLPLYVFHRSYSMYFFSQFSADYAALAPTPAPPVPPAAPGPPVPPTPPPAGGQI